MKHLLACLGLAVIACQSPEGPDPGLEPNPLPASDSEIWAEKLPEGTFYFAGCRMDTLATEPMGRVAGEGRFTLVENCSTDVSVCTPEDEGRKCTDFRWTNRYHGTFRRDDSLLTINYRFYSTTAPEHAPGPGNDSGEAVFKLTLIDWAARLVLEWQGDASALFGKPVLELTRLR